VHSFGGANGSVIPKEPSFWINNMDLLFVAGVMNLFWVAIVAVFVLIEKIVPKGHWVSRATGLLLIGWGIWMVVEVPY